MLTKRVENTESGQAYMDWHRYDLPNFCSMTDIDSCELTANGFPLAFIELKNISKVDNIDLYKNSMNGYVMNGKIGRLFRFMAKPFNAKAWCVLYHFTDVKTFHVLDLFTGSWAVFSEPEYKALIQELHSK